MISIITNPKLRFISANFTKIHFYFQRRAKAYADEVEKLNEDCKKSVEKAQRQFVNILS